MKAVYNIVVIEQVTQRVGYEVTGVESQEEAVAAYQAGQATETDRTHLFTDRSAVEGV
jgi:CheY-like chemotaxis protein